MSVWPTLDVWIDGPGHSKPQLHTVLTRVVPQAGVTFRAVDGTGEPGELNDLLARSTADWILWLDAAATLVPGAAPIIRSALARFDVDVFYGDTRLSDGTIIRRPSPSPIRLRSQDFLGPVRGFRSAALREAGGFADNAKGSHPHEVALRLGRQPKRTLRIPEVLAVAPSDLAGESAADPRIVSEFLAGLRIDTVVAPENGALRIRYPVRGDPLVSIVIPTRGSSAVVAGRPSVLVVDAVRGIIERTSFRAYEIVIVADDVTPQGVIDELVLIAGERLRLVRWSEPFNFSAKMNRGALYARGDYLILLNDDVELLSPDWIETMLGLAQQSAVGLVGTLLLFEDGTVQHGGHLYSGSWAGHIAFGWETGRDDRIGSLRVDREVSGVTAACAMIATDTFWEVGGFSPDFPGNYNDVDLSLKVSATGRHNIWTPHARLIHFESKSREATVLPGELEKLRDRWGTRLLSDPYWPEP